MTVETAEGYLPSDSGVARAFDRINVRYETHLGDRAYLEGLLEAGDIQSMGIFFDYIHAGIGWFANRSLSPFLRRTGTKAWHLLEPGPKPVITAINNDLLATTAQITGIPMIGAPPSFVPEGVISTRSLRDEREYFIVPIDFFLHAMAHPIEGVAHLAAGASFMRDIDQVDWESVRTQEHAAALMREMSMRSFAASTQVLLEAGKSYNPSSDMYAQTHKKGKRKFPNGAKDLPIEMQF